jgi:hypothetical protein
MQGVARVVLAHRLREVVALVRFTRFEAASPVMSGHPDPGVERAPLAPVPFRIVSSSPRDESSV